MVTDPQTNKHINAATNPQTQTGPITIHCAAKLSVQCDKQYSSFCSTLIRNSVAEHSAVTESLIVKSFAVWDDHSIFGDPFCDMVAEWLGRWTCDQQVAGSNPGRPVVECNPGQVVNTHVPLSPNSIIWYQRAQKL